MANPTVASASRATRSFRLLGGNAWTKLRALVRSSGHTESATITRVVSVLAGLAALMVALAPPATVYLAGRDRLLGALEASATLHAAEVADLAHSSPGFWDFDDLHVSAATHATGVAERRRVYNAAGHPVMTSEPDAGLAWPEVSQREPVMVDGKVVGEAEAARSLRGVLDATAMALLASASLGTLVFLLLSIAPLRLLNQAMSRASFLATHDLLTGLPNRVLFGDRLHQALAAIRRDGMPIAVLCLDLDRFKEVNDTLGHAAGDKLLTCVAGRLRANLRDSDTLARLGGDEFAIILAREAQANAAAALARRLIAQLEEPVDLDGHSVTIGVSIGIAIADPADPAAHARLMHDADLALYRTKESGRGGFCFFAPEMNRKLLERRSLEADLRAALEQGDFYLAYQPQVDLDTGKATGAEALLRWRRPVVGEMPPADFIPLTEATGLIVPIGAWVLREACRAAMTWPVDTTIAVNVSPVQLRQAGFYDSVAGALQDAGLAPHRLEIEITESVLLSDTEDTLRILNRLRDLGVRIAMDDFGTFYSSLGCLRRFPFDKVKIDRSFIGNLGDDSSLEAIVQAVIGIGDALGLHTIAEGVETARQADILRQRGCREGQGYLYGRPMPPDQIERLLRAQGCRGMGGVAAGVDRLNRAR